MGNFLLKKVIFCQVNINFWRGMVEGGHNGGENFIDFFHVSDHLEQFGRLLFFSKKNCEKINYLDGWGVPLPHPLVENSA